MTTPAPDAPLVFPSVAFRPGLLLGLCAALSAAAIAIAAWFGYVMVGVFFGLGLVLGLANALLVHRSVSSITADANPIKRKMALNSATRLLVITAIGLTIAFVFRPPGLGVVFGLADKIAVLVYGEIIAFDTPDAVRSNPRVQEAYLGSMEEQGH